MATSTRESSRFRDGARRAEASAHLPPTAFIHFLQNHDQIGNRGVGERLASLAEARALDALTAILLLSPQIPLLYMGEEWGETRPFCFFTDFHGALGAAVREGRRNEFRKWCAFQDPEMRARIPDPNAPATFEASKLDRSAPQWPSHDRTLALTAQLLGLRQKEIVPRLKRIGGHAGGVLVAGKAGLGMEWLLADCSTLTLFANLSGGRMALPAAGAASARGSRGRTLYQTSGDTSDQLQAGFLLAWSAVFTLTDAPATQDH